MRVQSGLSQHLMKRVRVLETDEILYRDESYFERIKENQFKEPVRNRSESVDYALKDWEEKEVDLRMTSETTEDKELGPLVNCKICGRTFISDRISKHNEICEKTSKSRPVFDVASVRVQGTEAGELVKTGRVKLEPAKPFEKKSELMKKYSLTSDEKEPKSAAASKTREKEKVSQGKSGAAYQVLFDDNDNMKTRKQTAGLPMGKLPTQMVKNGPRNELRYLSAKNWKKSRSRISPEFNSHGSLDEEDEDFLASSMASQKTVCSDAFDFLFDETNLNPEHVLSKEFSATPTAGDVREDVDKNLGQKKKESCCIIS